MIHDYATKQDLKDLEERMDKKISKRLNDSFQAFRHENNHNFQMMMDRFDEKFSKFTNLIITIYDPILKELETRQQDRIIATAEMKEVKTDITNLKKRATKLDHS